MTSLSYTPGKVFWRPTKIMNMRDLSKDDDFLSHLLVEKLGTGTVPLLVHKMDSSRRLPKTDADDLLQIVRRVRSPLFAGGVVRRALPLFSCIFLAGRHQGPRSARHTPGRRRTPRVRGAGFS